MSRVLIVDDEPLLVRALTMNLTSRGFEVVTAVDAAGALHHIAADDPDVVLLDLGLPDMDGTSVIDAMRHSRPELPILVLSARTTSQDKVGALDLGAVDYLTKPFDMNELVARLRATLRRAQTASTERLGRIGDITIDFDARTAVHGDGGGVHLTPTEWRILEVLMTSPGRLVGSRELLTEVRGDPDHTESSYLRIFVAQLRRKLEPEPGRPVHLITEPGMGYRFRP